MRRWPALAAWALGLGAAAGCGEGFSAGDGGAGGGTSTAAGTGAGTATGTTTGAAGFGGSSTGTTTSTGTAGAGGGVVQTDCGVGKIDDLTDDFADGVLASAWTKNLGDESRIQEDGGVLAFLLEPNKNAQSVFGVVSTYPYDLTECSVFVQVAEPHNTAAPAEHYFDVWYSNDEWMGIGVLQGGIYFVHWEGGVEPVDENEGAFEASQCWYRIREEAGTVYYETSADGMGWTIRMDHATPAWADDVQVELAARTLGSHPDPGVVKFDNFNVQP